MQPGDLQIEVTGFNFIFHRISHKNKKKLKENVQTGLYKNAHNWLTHMPHHSAVKVNTMTDVSTSVTLDTFKWIGSA